MGVGRPTMATSVDSGSCPQSPVASLTALDIGVELGTCHDDTTLPHCELHLNYAPDGGEGKSRLSGQRGHRYQEVREIYAPVRDFDDELIGRNDIPRCLPHRPEVQSYWNPSPKTPEFLHLVHPVLI